MTVVVCDYCCNRSKLVTGRVIYPNRDDLHHKKFYLCEPCKAYVGCHPNTEKPLGRLANAELRKWKNNAHAVFDPLWKSKKMSRASAYKWLSEALKINRSKCHIGMFDVDMCKKTVETVMEFKKEFYR